LRQVRIYQKGPYEKGQLIELMSSASQHVGLVLRMNVGENIILFSGENQEFPSTIEAIHKKTVTVKINDCLNITRESPRKIHLAQAISKGERMDFVIQKAVELGVFSITPLLTTHCVVRLDAQRMKKKQQQWQAIAIAACEQSGRNYLPMIHEPTPLETFVNSAVATTKLVLHPKTETTWQHAPFPDGDIALLIGPEGGLSQGEVLLAMEKQFKPWCLGPRILRTETAALAGLSILQAITGDMGF